ncbi:hypothetical protein ACO0SA_003956 [Hanseniaspora valbyensis]
MSIEENLIDENFLDSLFLDDFDFLAVANKELEVNPNKTEASITEFQQTVATLAKESKEKDVMISKFIERLTLQLYSDIENLKKYIQTPVDSSIFNKHEQIVNTVNKLNSIFDKLVVDETTNEKGHELKDLENVVQSLTKLNNVRDNLKSSIKTLQDFNELINKDDNKKIISSISMQNELKQRILEKDQLGEEDIIQLKKFKDILKDFDKLYVIYTNFLIELEENGSTEQMAEMSIQQHF